ncbi:unnamed protein product [Amaranthus hypochondriacus]
MLTRRVSYDLRPIRSTPKSSKIIKRSCKKNRSSDKLISEEKYVDKDTEDEVKNYARIAFDDYNKCQKIPYIPVEADNLHHLGQGVYHEKAVYHLNFMAKQDIADTEPQLFFAELIQTTEYIAVTSVRRIDPIPSPSEKADTLGCLYCQDLHVHHPQTRLAYQDGRGELWEVLLANFTKLWKHFKEDKNCFSGLQPPIFNAVEGQRGVCYTGVRKYKTTPLRSFVTQALIMYNEENGTDFKFVRTITDRKIMGMPLLGIIIHMNFMAKNHRVSDAPLETFFAEIVYGFNFFLVNICQSVGLTRALPKAKRKAEVYGCVYCEGLGIHHYPGAGYQNGRTDFYTEEKICLGRRRSLL